MNDKFREECGVFGIWGHVDAAVCTCAGLTALQHRGQDSSGIAVSDWGQITRVCRRGVTAHLIPGLEGLKGTAAIGHVRYSTVGESGIENGQPIVLNRLGRSIALCHNGQIINFEELKTELDGLGTAWMTTSDSELVLQLCRISKQPTTIGAIIESLARLRGAYSLLLLTNHELIAARDPHGFRPLCMGSLGDAVIVCSETRALDAVAAKYIREIDPGEVVVIGSAGIVTRNHLPRQERAQCIFEHVYFARPDSCVFGENVGSVRLRLGRALAREASADADIIVPVPDSGVMAALGYGEESGLKLRPGLVCNSALGRTFIEPKVAMRESNRKLKLEPVPEILAGHRVVLVDDSIVRGETMGRIVDLVRQGGAREVHIRIASPPTIASCFYGINTPTTAELIAASHSIDEIQKLFGADSLRYLSLEGLLKAVSGQPSSYCTSCYTNNYRICPPSLSATNNCGCACQGEHSRLQTTNSPTCRTTAS